jgi:HTH-type transcriptional regulator/antitoxin MqsA
MKCPCCGAAELIHDTRDIPYIYKGDATTIPAVKGYFCPACGEVVLNKEQGDRYGEFIRQFQHARAGFLFCGSRNVIDVQQN